jgi:predicted ribosome quality control (RQC) complex YloA/Tae2 family protein
MFKFNLSAMQALLPEVRLAIVGARLKSIQEVSPRTFTLQFEGKISPLLLCFQAPWIRFHLLKYPPKGTVTPWIDKLEALLKEQKCLEAKLINDDRILQIVFEKGFSLLGEFFSKTPNFYLLDPSWHILETLSPSKALLYAPPAAPVNSPQAPSFTTSQALADEISRLEFQKDKELLLKKFARALKASLQSSAKLQEQFQLAQTWPAIQHEGVLLQAHLYLWKKGISSLEVQDWEQGGKSLSIALDPQLTAEEAIQRCFTLAKKYKLKQTLEQIAHATTLTEWTPKKTETKQANKSTPKPLPYYEFTSAAGVHIRVGKSSHKNEELTFKHAQGSDLWLHVSDYPGSHVVVKIGKGKKIDRETLLDAMTLAIAHSKAKSQGKVEVLFAFQKNVSRLRKGAPGKVQVAHAKKELIAFDPERLEKIKRRRPLL